MLLEYFGEAEAANCGVCDVCLERSKEEVSSEEFEGFKLKIQKLLKKENLTIDELMESFSPKRQNQVLKVIEYLLDEKIMTKENNKLAWNG
jgi:ATP-dependent DNA helicase RecQ